MNPWIRKMNRFQRYPFIVVLWIQKSLSIQRTSMSEVQINIYKIYLKVILIMLKSSVTILFILQLKLLHGNGKKVKQSYRI